MSVSVTRSGEPLPYSTSSANWSWRPWSTSSKLTARTSAIACLLVRSVGLTLRLENEHWMGRSYIGEAIAGSRPGDSLTWRRSNEILRGIERRARGREAEPTGSEAPSARVDALRA